MKFASNRILVFVLALLFGFASDVQGQSASELQSNVATTYSTMKAMSASFVQVSTSDFMDGPERFSGTLLFSGIKYRIQTSAQTIVTDGSLLWVYNRSEKQVIINDFVEDESSFSLTSLLQQLGDRYEASLDGEEGKKGGEYAILNLIPMEEDIQFQRVTLHVRSSDFIVTHVEVLDFNDVLMVFDLDNIVVNPEVDATSFSFTPPPGVERIDLRN